MKIGIIGAGRIGGTLGTLWAQAGHSVFFSSRHPENLRELVKKLSYDGHSAQAGTVEQAAEYGEVILFSPPFWQTEEALTHTGPNKCLLDHKVVIDATNPFTPDGNELALPTGTTAASELVKKIPKARLVKAFNTVYWQTLRDMHHQPLESRYVICYAGNEDEPKHIVAELIEGIGFIAFDLGPLQNASLMEPGGPFFNQEYTWEKADQVMRSLGRASEEAA
jgi:predicted dinucleotide-binding enzyme